MTPEETKAVIVTEYHNLQDRAKAGQINESCITMIIESRAREAARHGGIPEYWREYLPWS